jgi:succinate dehydrogenase / fumarate reductase flavoprotein subunit
MSESLRNDGRVWVPKNGRLRAEGPAQIPEAERDYYLERIYPSFGNLVPATSPRAPPSACATRAAASARGRAGVYLDFADAIKRLGKPKRSRALRQPLRHVRAHHRREPLRDADAHLPRRPLHDGRPVGGLQPDEHVPGLFVLGEANFSDHGANRLGASALMQGLADGYFVPSTTR